MKAPQFKPGDVRAPRPAPLSLQADVGPPAYRAFSHVAGAVSSGRLNYSDIYAFAWWRAGDKEAPVRLELSEELGGLFTEVSASADYLPSVDRPFGSEQLLSAEGRAVTLYTGQVARQEAQGLVSVQFETMLTRLQNFEPETLRTLGPFTARSALETMLRAWRGEADWLTWQAVPELLVETEQAYVVPQLGALLLEQPEDLSSSKTSAYGWLEQFFSLFSEYAFRVSATGTLSVIAPRRDPAKGLDLGFTGPRFKLPGTGESRGYTFGWGAAAVEFQGQVRRGDVNEVLIYDFESLRAGEANRRTAQDGHTVVLELFFGALSIRIEDADPDAEYEVLGTFFVTEAAPQEPVRQLGPRDVGFDITESVDIDGVVNRCSVSSQGFTFVFEQELMEPSYALYRDDEPGLDGEYVEPTDRKEITTVWTPPEGTLIGSDTVRAAINVEAYDANGFQRAFGQEVSLPAGESVRVTFEHRPNSNFTQFELILDMQFTGTEVQLFEVSRRIFYQSSVRPSAWIVLLNASGDKFARSDKRVFQRYDESAGSPYGVRREDIDAGPFPLSNDVALAIATRRVAEAKEPRTLIEFDQSPRLPVLPSDLGAVIGLPDGRRGRALGFSYSEAHTPQGSLSRSRVKLRLESDI